MTPQDIITAIVSFSVAVGVMLLVLRSSSHARLRRRISRLRNRKVASKTPSDSLSLKRQTGKRVSPFLATLLRPLPNIESVSHTLQRAGSAMDAKQYMFRCLLGMLVVAFVASLLHQPLWAGLLVGYMLSVWFPYRVLKGRISKTYRQFLKLFPDAIDLIVRGLRSGLPVSESINLVASEVPAPVSTVFGHIVNTVKLGVPLEKALQEMAKKLSYTEFNFFVTSIVLQRETGGNLSEILNNLAEVLRKRIMLQLKIKAMTSEARVSSVIVGALPLVVMGAVSVMSPGYLSPLFHDTRGEKAAGVAAGLLVGGLYVMRRLGKFEI